MPINLAEQPTHQLEAAQRVAAATEEFSVSVREVGQNMEATASAATRTSNTMPVVVLSFEAGMLAALARIQDEFKSAPKEALPGLIVAY